MGKQIALVMALLAVGGCGDPLANTPKLSEVELATQTPIFEALPAPEENAGTGGLFNRLMRKRVLDATDSDVLAVGGSSDGDPNSNTESVLENRATAIEETPARKPPRRIWPFGRKVTPAPVALVEATIESNAPAEHAAVEQTAIVDPSTELVEADKRRKMFGLLRRAKSTEEAAAGIQLASIGPTQAASVATLPVPEATDAVGVSSPPRRGLFGRLLGSNSGAKLSGPDAREVALGTVLPYGKIGRVCGAKKAQLGREVATYPERRPVYRLYDSDPGNIATHVFYLTGFPDGCARVFSAALALFGSPVMHERLRYGLPDETQPYSATDRAYEQVKSRICRVGRKKPCGTKIRLLEKDTVFLSIYENFEENARWSNMLLHSGQVMAFAQVDG